MARDRGDFVDAYDEHVWEVYGYLGYRLESRQEAEDLTQETFERALRSWQKFDPEKASLRTWLLTIARNLLIDRHRRRGPMRGEPIPEDVDRDPRFGVAPGPEAALGLTPDLEAALASLGDRQRELIALRFGGDLSGAEIAELTGLTVANVQQILSRTLRRLQAELESSEARTTAG
jgi:RNA polymerase sigma-70 factor (ECF subfamily)